MLELHAVGVRILGQHAGLWVELALKSLQQVALEGIKEQEKVLSSAEQQVFAIW